MSLGQQLASCKDISQENVVYVTEPMTHLRRAMDEWETLSSSMMKQEKQQEFVTKEAQLRVVIQCDLIYYRLYYIVLTTLTTQVTMIPHPATYFSCHGLAWDVTAGHEALQRYLPHLDEDTRILLLDTWGLGDDSKNNPLHALWNHRLLETIRHFWDAGYVHHHSTRSFFRSLTTNQQRQQHPQNSNDDDQLSQHETTALSPLLSSWRDACRDTPASYYAYATPCPTALRMIATAVGGKKIVELGAGTGYWAALLRQRTVNVVAYDIAPTGGDGNEYHGRVPSFTAVRKGDVTTSLNQSLKDDDVLMLCYPPPDSEMATEALHLLNPTMVIHVGEWRGLTGTRRFEELLLGNYECVDGMALPFWGTDAASLTIWRKRQQQLSSLSSSLSATKSYNGCFRQNCTKMAQKRCRLARCIAYCSKECFEMDDDDERRRRRSVMALHMLDVPPPAATSGTNSNEQDGTRRTATTDWLDFCNEGHFLDINSTSHASKDERGGMTTAIRSQKKKKKKGHGKKKKV